MREETGIQPKAGVSEDDEVVDEFLRRAPAALISLIVHLVVLICLALLSYRIDVNEPFVIEIGEPNDQQPPEIQSIVIDKIELDIEPVVEDVVAVPIELDDIEIQGTNVQPDVNVEVMFSGAMKGYSHGFSNRIRDAQLNGIDIAVVFDSTGSMKSEIHAVKQRISQIGTVVLKKIPKARFSLATYRDLNESYLVRGIELGSDVQKVQSFVNAADAQGGGDHPEAVQAGMAWALQTNRFRPEAQKVMLVFGDAPPHRSDVQTCLDLARQFHGYDKGRVYTVTCRSVTPLPEFYLIAQAGGGEAFVMQDSEQLMEYLLVMAFGPEHREQVLKFFQIRNSDRRQRPGDRRPRRRGRI